MKCLVCIYRATAKMIRIKTITINSAKYNIYRCNGCANEVFIPASRDK